MNIIEGPSFVTCHLRRRFQPIVCHILNVCWRSALIPKMAAPPSWEGRWRTHGAERYTLHHIRKPSTCGFNWFSRILASAPSTYIWLCFAVVYLLRVPQKQTRKPLWRKDCSAKGVQRFIIYRAPLTSIKVLLFVLRCINASKRVYFGNFDTIKKELGLFLGTRLRSKDTRDMW